jgi:hypothetical protein
MKKFRGINRIEGLIREQLIGGTKVALAFVKAHHPRINLDAIGGRLPIDTEGGRLEMGALYELASSPAENIIDQVKAETNLLIEQGWMPLEES